MLLIGQYSKLYPQRTKLRQQLSNTVICSRFIKIMLGIGAKIGFGRLIHAYLIKIIRQTQPNKACVIHRIKNFLFRNRLISQTCAHQVYRSMPIRQRIGQRSVKIKNCRFYHQQYLLICDFSSLSISSPKTAQSLSANENNVKAFIFSA